MNLAEFRKQYPQYNDLSDKDLVVGFQKKFYPDMTLNDVMNKVGYRDSLAQTGKDIARGAMAIPETLRTVVQNTGASAVGGVSSLLAAIQNLLGHNAGDPTQIRHDVTGALSYQSPNSVTRDLLAPVGTIGEAINNVVEKGISALPAGAQPYAHAAKEGATDALNLTPVGALEHGVTGAVESSLAGAPAIARAPADVAAEAGYTGLKTKGDMTNGGNQAITDTLIKQHAGLKPDVVPSQATLTDALNSGPGAVYNRARASVPDTMTANEKLTTAIKNIDDTTSQLPKSPDIEALKETMLGQPEMTADQLFSNVRVARQRASSNLASDDPNKQDLGAAYHALGNAYEDFIGDQLSANPAATVGLPEWQLARQRYAQNRDAAAALHGENFDPAVFARMFRKDPNLLTGNGAIVGQVHDALKASKPSDAVLPTVAAGGAGELISNHLGLPPGIGALTGAVATPQIRSVLGDFLHRGNPEAAAGTSSNPALAYFFDKDRSSPFPPNLSLTPPPGRVGSVPPTQGDLGPLPQGPGPNPDLQLTPPPGNAVAPHQYQLGDQFALGAGINEPPMRGITNRVARTGAGNTSLAPEDQWFTNPPRYGQLGDVMSQGVPEGIVTRSRPGFRPEQSDFAGLQGPGFSETPGITNNGSSPGASGAGSAEAISRVGQEKAAGQKRFEIDRDGNRIPLTGVGAVDHTPAKGNITTLQHADGTEEIVNRGGLSPMAARGYITRAQAMDKQPGLGDQFAFAGP